MPTVKEYIKQLINLYKPNDVIAVHLWGVEDVICSAKMSGKKCSGAKAKRIIKYIHNHIDSELGITWTTIECALDEVK